MFLGGGGGGDGSFPGWDHPDESLGLSQVQHRLLTSPLPRGSGITQPWSQDGICPSLLSPAACSVRAWHRATEPEREGGSTCLSVAVSFPSRLDSLPAPHTASAPNFPFHSHKGSSRPTTQGASSASGGPPASATWAPCPLSWPALAQDGSNRL